MLVCIINQQQNRYEDYIPDVEEGDEDFLGGFFGTVSYVK